MGVGVIPPSLSLSPPSLSLCAWYNIALWCTCTHWLSVCVSVHVFSLTHTLTVIMVSMECVNIILIITGVCGITITSTCSNDFSQRQDVFFYTLCVWLCVSFYSWYLCVCVCVCVNSIPVYGYKKRILHTICLFTCRPLYIITITTLELQIVDLFIVRDNNYPISSTILPVLDSWPSSQSRH